MLYKEAELMSPLMQSATSMPAAPPTSDSSPLFILVVVMIISAILLVGLIASGRKKGKHEK